MEQDILYKTCGDIFPMTYTDFRKVLQINILCLTENTGFSLKKWYAGLKVSSEENLVWAKEQNVLFY